MEKGIDWKNIIFRGVESDTLDYKAAQNWQKLSRAGKAKFARHCLAMANTNGGYVVVGVGENAAGQPDVFTGLTEEEAQSFDPTDVGTFINRHADPQIDFTIERPVLDGKRYAVFVIRRFKDLPHVCTAGIEHELQQGVFYIRTADASSRPAYRASEIHALIQRAMRNQREMLGRMLRGILYESQVSGAQDESKSLIEEEFTHTLAFFRKHLPGSSSKPFFGFAVTPQNYAQERFTLSELYRQVTEAVSDCRSPFFIHPSGPDVKAYSTNTSIRCFNGTKVWQLYCSGSFFFFGEAPAREGKLDYDDLLGFAADTIFFAARLYPLLGFADELLKIDCAIENTEGLELRTDAAGTQKFICGIPQIRTGFSRTASDLASGREQHALDLFSALCERFNFPDGRHKDLRQRLEMMFPLS